MELRKNKGIQSHIKRNLVKELNRLHKYKESVIQYGKPVKNDLDIIYRKIRQTNEELSNIKTK